MSARIPPAYPPFPEGVEELLSKRERDDRPSFALFTTLGRDERLLRMFFSGSHIDSAGQLSLRNRDCHRQDLRAVRLRVRMGECTSLFSVFTPV
jgi:hypothetical protein